MATVSNAGGGSSMGNAQQGTRGLSAGDWVRLQRLRQARTYRTVNLATNKDIAPITARQISPSLSGAINVSNVVGTSKIRRTASNWTDFVASQTADYVLSGQRLGTNGIPITGVVNSVTRLCSCTTTILLTKVGICSNCGNRAKPVPTKVRMM